ncbi:hypothetical protein ABPG74_013123 [Tetrahymena malaccensis]
MTSVYKEKERLLKFYKRLNEVGDNSDKNSIHSAQSLNRPKSLELSDLLCKQNSDQQQQNNLNLAQQKSQELSSIECKSNIPVHQQQQQVNIPYHNSNQNFDQLNLSELQRVQNVNDIIRYWPQVIQYLNILQRRIQELQINLNSNNRQ